MKKTFLIFVGILFLISVVVMGLRLLTPEDTWICQNGKWVKHGNPKAAMPVKPCQAEGEKVSGKEEDTGLPNPAAKNCLDKGGRIVQIEETAGTLGICRFNDGTECEEWQFYREECQKGQLKTADTTHPYSGFINKTSAGYTFKSDGGVIYSLKLAQNPTKELQTRLASETNRKESVTIVASETPPLSKALILKGFQEK